MSKVEKFEESQKPRNGAKPIYYFKDPNGCFICISHRIDHGGYAKLFRGGKELKMHRYTFTIKKGEILPGLQMRHLCNNPSCVNPDHLVPGTAEDNGLDRRMNNRERKKTKRLTDDEKLAIYYDREHSIPELAKIYEVTYNTIVYWRKKFREQNVFKPAA